MQRPSELNDLMRELSVVEHRAGGGAMNNRPQNGSRGLIAEPVAVSVPAWPAQPALTLCGILSGFPHSFRHYSQGRFSAFQSLVPSHARNYNFAVQRAQSHRFRTLNVTSV